MTDISEHRIEDWQNGHVELYELMGLDAQAMTKLRGRAQFFIDGGHAERALIMLEMLEELDRSDLRPTLAAFDLLLADGRSDAAEEKLERLIARAPDDPEVRAAWAELLVSSLRLEEAARILEGLIGDDPDAETPAGRRAHRLVHETLRRS